MTVVGQTDLPLERIRRGKVRDVYAVDADRLLLVASDRVSAFDVVMHELVPFKGAVLTQITAWWLRKFEGDVAHHMLSVDVDEIVRAVAGLSPRGETLVGGAMHLVQLGPSLVDELADRGLRRHRGVPPPFQPAYEAQLVEVSQRRADRARGLAQGGREVGGGAVRRAQHGAVHALLEGADPDRLQHGPSLSR